MKISFVVHSNGDESEVYFQGHYIGNTSSDKDGMKERCLSLLVDSLSSEDIELEEVTLNVFSAGE